MPEQIFLDSEVCDFASLASGYRQYPLPRTAICRSVRRAKLIVSASHVSEGHPESERNGGFRPHPYVATKDVRAARGPAATPPSSVMNSRRPIIRSPRRHGRAVSAG